jgi:hypothetical protein
MSINSVLKVGNALCACMRLGTIAEQIYKARTAIRKLIYKENPTNAEKFDAAAQAALALLRTGELAIPGNQLLGQTSLIPSHHSSSLRVGAAVADLICQISGPIAERGSLNLDERINIVASISIESGYCIERIHDRMPELLNLSDQKITNLNMILNTSVYAIKCRKNLVQLFEFILGTSLGKTTKKIGLKVYGLLWNDPHSEPVLSPRPQCHIIAEQLAQDYAIADQQYGRELREKIQSLQQIVGNIDSVNEIPSLLLNHDLIQQFRCSISKQPIRYILVPQLSEEILRQNKAIRKVFYEKSAIENWIKRNPDQIPPEWPCEYLPLPLQVNYLKSSPHLQDIIDENLKQAATDFLQEISLS